MQWGNKQIPEQPYSQKATRALSLGLDCRGEAREAYRQGWFGHKAASLDCSYLPVLTQCKVANINSPVATSQNASL